MNQVNRNQKLHDAEETLHLGVKELGLNLEPKIINKLLIYKDLLIKWNKKINLTALRDDMSITTHHLLDCLAILKYIKGEKSDILTKEAKKISFEKFKLIEPNFERLNHLRQI